MSFVVEKRKRGSHEDREREKKNKLELTGNGTKKSKQKWGETKGEREKRISGVGYGKVESETELNDRKIVEGYWRCSTDLQNGGGRKKIGEKA